MPLELCLRHRAYSIERKDLPLVHVGKRQYRQRYM
nr:MAG TPA: hypothetical protein [Caudoviricetes sp.]